MPSVSKMLRIAGFVAMLASAAVTCASASSPDGKVLQFVASPKPVILRCTPYFSTPCFRIEVGLADGSPFAVSTPDRLINSVHVKFDEQVAQTFYVASSGTTTGQLRYTLILIDISGSMKTLLPGGQTRFEAAKGAAKVYLRNFDPARDRIAVAPFESHDVVSKIRGAEFGRTQSEVGRQIDGLPAPRGNTGLYAAVAAGLDRLNAAKKTNSNADLQLVLLTDGKNDIEPGDDGELLDRQYNLSSVVAKLDTAGVPVLAVGLGPMEDDAQIDLKELGGQNVYFASDAQDLHDVFSRARGLQTDRLRISFNCPLDSGRLGGKNHTIEVLVDGPELTAKTIWSAPDMLTPGFDGSIDADEDLALQRANLSPLDASPLKGVLRPLLVFVAWSAALLTFWFVIPRFVWPERYLERFVPDDGHQFQTSIATPPERSTGGSQRSGSDETIVADRASGATRTRLN
jgi:von Willebrand factor type A domain